MSTPRQPLSADLLDAAWQLAEHIGRERPRALSLLNGGNNNRVFRVEMNDGAPLILKSYFRDPRDPRDRLAAEWAFLSFAWTQGIRCTPEPLANDASSQIALYSFVCGERISARSLNDACVAAALDFVLKINAERCKLSEFGPGSEACFSLAQHLTTVRRRVDRLSGLAPDVPLRDEAQDFIARRLRPTWLAVEQRATAAAERRCLDLTREIGEAESILSPSDFGFHNALANAAGQIIFLDFEYAGRDDPAKLICDFFCQPEVPVPAHHFEPFLARIVDGLNLDVAVSTRCHLLFDAYRVKWACIMLNEFLPVGAARRAFAHPGDWEDRCRSQLAKARTVLDSLP